MTVWPHLSLNMWVELQMQRKSEHVHIIQGNVHLCRLTIKILVVLEMFCRVEKRLRESKGGVEKGKEGWNGMAEQRECMRQGKGATEKGKGSVKGMLYTGDS